MHLGYERSVLPGDGFQHVVYRKDMPSVGATLHVYIEGDGTPWLRKTVVSYDPTPGNPLMLRLMAIDSAPSIYLGRPCYFGLAQTPPCEPLYWTYERYSEKIVASMRAALRGYLRAYDLWCIVFFGHSGGGTLAMLLAERFPETTAVVTVAGNLNVSAWAAHHGYSALSGSLNPADRPKLPEQVKQIHYVGTMDRTVPPALIEPVIVGQINARLIPVDGFNDYCCWEQYWPSVLQAVHDSAHE